MCALREVNARTIMDDYKAFINFCLALKLITATISTFASLLTLIILWQMRALRRNNAYLRIVLDICMSQMVFDLGFFIQVENSNALFRAGNQLLYLSIYNLILSCSLKVRFFIIGLALLRHCGL